MAQLDGTTGALDAHSMNLYSRQLGAYGLEAMSKLVKMKVLIVGLGGVGVESAKNIVLAGPGAVTVVDNGIVEIRDLGSNFFLREEDVGKKSRAEACLPHLQSLNRLVDIKVHRGALTEEVVKAHTAALFCGPSRDEALKWNKFCRANNVGFFLTGVNGLFGYSFVDLGDEFTVRDRNGEQPVSRILDGIDTKGGEADNEMILHLIPAPDGRRHNIEDTEHEGWVQLDEVQGKLGEVVNGKGPFRARHVYMERKDPKTGKPKKVFDAYSLRVIVHTAKTLPEYEGGGMFNQVKVPERIKFHSLEKSLEQPVHEGDYGLLFTDGAKFGRADQLHVALQGLWEFQSRNNGKLPVPNDDEQVEKVIQFAVERNDRLKKLNTADNGAELPPYLALEEVDESVVKMVAQHAASEFQPLCAFFGGVMAQEVVKMTGKFTPLHQWLHIDCFEVLPEMFVDESNSKAFKVSSDDRKPIGSRYDDLITIVGRTFQESLLEKRIFMVGCGALGCELLKNCALLGISCSTEGELVVTDNDTIEVSNLSRQFLFREHNVGQPKSAAAGKAVAEMNPELKVKALQQFVGPSTENIFNDQFWESRDLVLNALDNVKARLYVDEKCVFYEKPLMESGTLGTKCNVQVVLPHLTQSYSDGPKDDEGADAIPMCTLRNFPSQIEHCIEWARARFTDLFSTTAQQAHQFCENPESWLDELRQKTLEQNTRGKLISAVTTEMEPVKEIIRLINQAKSPDNCFALCVKEAFLLFHRLFRDNIVSLIETYPEDSKDKSGNLFWSGTKRFPQAGHFDSSNTSHMDFVISTANLLAVNYGLQPADQPLPEDHPWRSPSHVSKILAKLAPPSLVKEKVDMTGGGEEDESDNGDKMEIDNDDNLIAEFKSLLEELENMKGHVEDLQIESAEFEKDADWNFHIDFITAASNLRAWNYRLKSASRHQTKMIAGKIIPAIATTTAAVTGLVMIEMLKAFQPGKKIEAFKDSSNSLGINGYFFSEPSPPAKAKDEYDPIEMSEVKCKPPGFSKWDKTHIRSGSLTVSEFLKEFKKSTGLNCVTLYHSSAERVGCKGHSQFIYEKSAWKKDLKQLYEDRLSQNLEEITETIYGEDAIAGEQTYVALVVAAEDDEDTVYKVPPAIYHFK